MHELMCLWKNKPIFSENTRTKVFVEKQTHIFRKCDQVRAITVEKHFNPIITTDISGYRKSLSLEN